MWVIAAILGAAYCVARAVVDLRQKDYLGPFLACWQPEQSWQPGSRHMR